MFPGVRKILNLSSELLSLVLKCSFECLFVALSEAAWPQVRDAMLAITSIPLRNKQLQIPRSPAMHPVLRVTWTLRGAFQYKRTMQNS